MVDWCLTIEVIMKKPLIDVCSGYRSDNEIIKCNKYRNTHGDWVDNDLDPNCYNASHTHCPDCMSKNFGDGAVYTRRITMISHSESSLDNIVKHFDEVIKTHYPDINIDVN